MTEMTVAIPAEEGTTVGAGRLLFCGPAEPGSCADITHARARRTGARRRVAAGSSRSEAASEPIDPPPWARRTLDATHHFTLTSPCRPRRDEPRQHPRWWQWGPGPIR